MTQKYVSEKREQHFITDEWEIMSTGWFVAIRRIFYYSTKLKFNIKLTIIFGFWWMNFFYKLAMNIVWELMRARDLFTITEQIQLLVSLTRHSQFILFEPRTAVLLGNVLFYTQWKWVADDCAKKLIEQQKIHWKFVKFIPKRFPLIFYDINAI
jgi:hypothetical protein